MAQSHSAVHDLALQSSIDMNIQQTIYVHAAQNRNAPLHGVSSTSSASKYLDFGVTLFL